MPFQFHQQTFGLMSMTPSISLESLTVLDRTEKDLGFTFPPSFREWYSIENAISILQAWTNSYHLPQLTELGYVNQPPDIKEALWPEKLLWFMTENQGVCFWAIKLNDSEDPEVWIWVDGTYKWESQADKFSTFVWCQAFDFGRQNAYYLHAQAETLANNDLSYLNDIFRVAPKTYSWPGEQNHRFYRGDQRILIWSNPGQADWTLSASNPDQLYDLAKIVWNCGNLKTSLYAIDPIGESALKQVHG